MRTQMFGSFLLAALVGCGGGGGGDSRPDAKIFLDAPIDAPPMCAVTASLGGLSLGSMAMPVSADNFDQPTMGPFMGRTVFSVGGRLPSSTATLLDVLIVDYVKPVAGGFLTNTAVNFDPNPNAVYVAASYLFGDFDSSAMTVQNFYYANSGSVTLTQIAEANGSPINGTVAATNYREVDDAGADVAGGCTTALTGLAFNLVEMTAFQPGQVAPGGLIPLTPDEMKAAREMINRKMANVRQ